MRVFVLLIIGLLSNGFVAIDAQADQFGKKCSGYFSQASLQGASGQIDEIVASLQPGAPLPEKLLLKSSAAVGEALVRRFERLKAQAQLIHGQDISKEADLILFFDPANAQSIKTYGFLNQHQIGHSNGSFDPKFRKEVEDYLVQVKLGSGTEALQLRPKFAFLNLRSNQYFGDKEQPVHGMYGAAGAVLKNSVQRRTLWAAADSNMLLSDSVRYSRSPSGMYKYFGSLSNFAIPPEIIERQKLPDFQWKYNTSFEGIVFGKLTIKDVDHFVVLKVEDAKTLKSLSKPVLLVEPVKFQGRLIYRVVKKLY